MKSIPTKANLSGGDDSGTATKFGAKELNSIADELENFVISTGETLSPGTGDDPDTDMMSRGITIASQTAHSYQDSGSVNAYTLTRTGSLEQPSSYVDGTRITFITTNANTGASTVNVSSLGSKKILLQDGVTALSGGEIRANEFVDLVYNSAADSAAGAFTTIKQLASETVVGVVELATDAEAQAFTAGKFIDGAKLATALEGANQSLTTSGYQKLPGGLIVQWQGAVHTAGKNTAQTFSFPIAFPNAQLSMAVLDSSTVASYPVIWSTLNITTSQFDLHWTFGDLTSGVTSRSAKIISIGY